MSSRQERRRGAIDVGAVTGRFGDVQDADVTTLHPMVSGPHRWHANGGEYVELKLRAERPGAMDGLAAVELSIEDAKQLREELDHAIEHARD